MLRFLAILFTISLVVLLGFLLDAQSQMPVPTRAQTPVTSQIFAPGRVEGSTEEIELRPQIRGQIVSLPVAEGSFVKPGDLLVQIDPRQHEHELVLAQTELNRALAERDRLKNGARQQERDEAIALYQARLAEYNSAKLALQRTERLRQGSAVSQQEADDQRSKVETLAAQMAAAKARAELLAAPAREDELAIADAKIAAAQSNIELAKVMLDRTTLRATAAGQVLKINAEAGELGGPDSVEPTIVLADTRQLRVRAFVEELDAPRVQLGMTAQIVADGLPDQVLIGRVTRLSPRMSAKQIWNDDPAERYDTKSREIWIDLDGDPSLVVGLRVDVRIAMNSQTQVVKPVLQGGGGQQDQGKASVSSLR